MGIRVLVADDHDVVRSGLLSLLKDSPVEVVGEATNGQQAIEKNRECHPDVVLLDIRMPDTDGLHALEAMRSETPAPRVVMLSTHDNPTYVARSVALGASDYVLKGCTRSELIQAIQSAAAGESPRKGSLMTKVANVMSRRNGAMDDTASLTNRESQVLRHVALGLSNREIGRSLGISIETVKEHVQSILRKLNVNSRTQAAIWAVRKGVV